LLVIIISIIIIIYYHWQTEATWPRVEHDLHQIQAMSLHDDTTVHTMLTTC